MFQSNGVSSIFDSSIFRPLKIPQNTLDCTPVFNSPAEIGKAIKRLRDTPTRGPDGIPSFLVKDCQIIFNYPLFQIFNAMLHTSNFPDVWKIARVAAVH